MKENTYKPQIPDMMEAIFDAVYLIFDLVAAILFFIYAKGNTLFVLYGILTLTLCGGDAFHLVPRIIRAVRGTSDKLKRQLSIGLQVSSITMTVFYIILMYIWKLTFPEFMIPVAIEAIVWISAVVRIVICLFPQNNWCTDEGNMKLSIIRNTVFAVTGIGVIILYAISGNANGYHMTRMVAAIIISFGCYLPVTLFSKTKPKVGLLMIPKTCAYMWVIAMDSSFYFKQLVCEKQASCFFRRVVQDDRKRVLDCVILSLKYGEQSISGLVNQEKVDIQDKKVDIGNIKVDIEI